MQTELKIEGMSCNMCVSHVTNALQGVEGVKSAQVDLDSGRALVEHEDADTQELVDAVEEEGYEAQLLS